MKKYTTYTKIGGILCVFLLIFMLVGVFWTPYDPEAMDAAVQSCKPNLTHLLGCDNLGRDILSRIMKGAVTTLTIGVATVMIGLVFGILIGGVGGYVGGKLDNLLMRFCDTITAFPSFLLALAIVSILGPGKYKVVIALGILFIPSFARIVRAEFARCKNQSYIENARLMGAGSLRIMFVHILPNTRQVLFSALAIGFNNAVLAEAGISYLGIGVQPPDASLGRMLADSQSYLLSAPWYALSAGILLVLLILGFSLLGEGLSEGRK